MCLSISNTGEQGWKLTPATVQKGVKFQSGSKILEGLSDVRDWWIFHLYLAGKRKM